MQVTQQSIDSIIPYARNPRKNTNAVDKVSASIQEFGFRQPIVVDSDNVIIAGHTRYEAAKKLGMSEVPVHVAESLTEQQVKAYRLADNRVSQESEWDLDLLKLELSDLDGMFTGFDQGEIDDLLDEEREGETDQESVPESEPEPITKQGDIWVCGNHRVMYGS
jgi:ParB-like chromosome segregation protein Spo0J